MKTCKDCGGVKNWYYRLYQKITIECNICGFQTTDHDTEYYQNFFPNDKYRKPSELIPDPIEKLEWHCPNNHNPMEEHISILSDEIREERMIDDGSLPYERQDDPDIIESIEMEDELCYCGHLYECHFPPWSPKKGICEFVTCSCKAFEIMDNGEEEKEE